MLDLNANANVYDKNEMETLIYIRRKRNSPKRHRIDKNAFYTSPGLLLLQLTIFTLSAKTLL